MASLIEYARSAKESLVAYMGPADDAPAPGADGGDAPSAALHAALAALAGNTRVRAPKLVVVGTQSSGKSSLLNALMGVDLLPTGESMTTRAAIHVQLTRSERALAEFGEYREGAWRPRRSVPLDAPPTPEQAAETRAAITEATGRLLGSSGGVARDDPVHVRLHSPHVPNMSFVDLPGITMTALTSEGQPADMCEQIRQMIASYVDDRTVVLLVCAARRDLEADAAVELCMRLNKGVATLGCLTKLDLCESPDGILPYLAGTHATDLRLEHGYFAVMCKGTAEAERSFFAARPQYRAAGHRVGTRALALHLHQLHTQLVLDTLPHLRADLEALHEETKLEYASKISTPPLVGPTERVAYCHDLLGKFCAHINSVVTVRRPDASVGRTIRDAFARLRADVRATDPFRDDRVFTDARILQAVANCEGWSMVSPVPPIEIVEFFVREAPERPVHAVFPSCLHCVDEVLRAVSDECEAAARRVFGQFAPLRQWAERVLARSFGDFRAAVTRDVHHALELEEAYVFTDNEAFLQVWNRSAAQRNATGSAAATLRGVLSAYYAVVMESVAHVVPKLVVLHVRRSLQTMHGELVRALGDADPETLLVESEDVECLRARLTETLHRTEVCLKSVGAVLA